MPRMKSSRGGGFTSCGALPALAPDAAPRAFRGSRRAEPLGSGTSLLVVAVGTGGAGSTTTVVVVVVLVVAFVVGVGAGVTVVGGSGGGMFSNADCGTGVAAVIVVAALGPVGAVLVCEDEGPLVASRATTTPMSIITIAAKLHPSHAGMPFCLRGTTTVDTST